MAFRTRFSAVPIEVPTCIQPGFPACGSLRLDRLQRRNPLAVGYLYRSSPHIGCYLSCRKDIPQAVRIYEQIEASLDELHQEMGDDLLSWVNSAGRPRIGFQRRSSLPFAAADDSADFSESVQWMRQKLDRLVSTLHPRLQRMLSGEG